MIWATFLMGFLGSLHCLGMCGPIVLALPIKKNGVEGIFQNVIYQIGRISTYAFMGIFFGALGKGIKITGLHQYVSILLGFLMILFVIIPQRNIKKYSSVHTYPNSEDFLKTPLKK